MENEDVVLFSGYAKLPAHITSEEIYKVLVVVTLVDMGTGEIVEAECSVVTDVSKRFLAKLLVGHNMNNGLAPLLEKLDRTYLGHAKKAVATALKTIFAKYAEIKGEHPGE